MKPKLGLVAACMLVLPSLAFADHESRPGWVGRVGVSLHVHFPGCEHQATPGGVPSTPGRYELQTVERWVPGYYTSNWIPGVCHTSRHGRLKHCRSGRYERRWVPGHVEASQEWVWVPASPAFHIQVSSRF